MAYCGQDVNEFIGGYSSQWGFRIAGHMKTRKVRSGPVYVETERGTISLVFEANVPDIVDAAPRPVGKPDVYVIDEDGVRLVRHKNRLLHALLVGAASYVVIWAISRTLRYVRL
jgi:hypothetical protein